MIVIETIVSFSECLCKCKHGDDLDKCDIRGNLKLQGNQRRSADFINYSCSASPPKPKDTNSGVDTSIWKPLLLVIPLRLGLTETNVVYVESLKVSLCLKSVTVTILQYSPFIKLCLGFIGLDSVISESCYKGTILQRNYRKMTILWSFSYNTFLKFHG